MSRFTLVGVDENAFSVMGYTQRCLKQAGLEDKIHEMRIKAMDGDYSNCICVCLEYVEMANKALEMEDEEDEF